jgi:hypothetical protein
MGEQRIAEFMVENPLFFHRQKQRGEKPEREKRKERPTNGGKSV